MISAADIAALRGRNVHVVGLASTECAAIVRFLAHQGVGPLTVHDFTPADRLRATFFRFHVGMPRDQRERVWGELQSLPLCLKTGDEYLQGIEQADAIFVGQAWYLYAPNLPLLADLRASGVPFHSLAELYFSLSPAPILAVTGSNGKSTTSRLIETILRQTPLTIAYAGNERRSVQVLDRLFEMDAQGWLLLEISNRQLIDLEPAPRIGVITNVLANHLDEHGGTLERYAAVKRKLVSRQGPHDWAVLNADNAITREFAAGLASRVGWFSATAPVERGAWLEDGVIWLRLDGAPARSIAPVALSPLVGAHNHENILAAVLAAALAGADDDAVRKGLAAFRGLSHRQQLVFSAAGVDYYDDLNSTTPQATVAALHALDSPVVLIVGGDDKGLDLGDLAAAIGRYVRHLIVLPGPGSERIAAAVAATSPPTALATVVEHQPDLARAVERAVAISRPGDRVLLSPACPNFFRHFYVGDADDEHGFRKLLRERLAPARRASAKGN